jgi:hypothetical protein
MFADEVAREAGPSGEVSGVDGFAPSGWYGAASGLVQIGDNVGLFFEFVDIIGAMDGGQRLEIFEVVV